MATLVKTGIGNQQTLTPVMITELYDAFTGDKLFDNINVNNTMKVYHDGRIAISRPGHSKSAPYALTVYGDIQGYVGRFNEVISNTMTFITSSGLIVSGSNMFGGLDTDTHVFTGSLFVSGSQSVSNFFLNKVGIGTDDVSDGHMLQVVGGVDVSNYVSSSILHVTQTGSIARLGIGTNVPDTVLHVVGDSGITLEETGESTRKLILEPPDGSTSAIIRAAGSTNGLLLRSDGGGNQIFLKNDGNVGIGTANPFQKLTVAGAISASGNLDVDGISILDGDITGSGNLRIEGTASFAHMDFSPSVNITSGSFGSLNITDMTIDNQVGLDREIVGINKEGKIDFTYPDRATITIKNLNGTTLSAGTPIFITSYISDEVYGAVTANSANPDRRPTSGILTSNLGLNETGSVTVSGVIRGENVDTSTHSVGTKLYLGSSELVSSKPTAIGTSIQAVAVVLKQSSTFGEMLMLPSAGVSNDTEVMEIDHVFLGSGTSTENIHLSGALDRTTLTNVTGTGTASFGRLEISGDSSLTGNVTFDGQVLFGDLNVSGDVSGSLIPKTDTEFTLGTHSKRWLNIVTNELISTGNVSGSGTGSFGHLIVEGNITASGTVRADAFESVTGGSVIDFKDSINITGNLTASGDLSINDLSIDDLTASGNISGSLTSTGSFGYGLFDQRVGIGIKDPSSILHISGTDGLIIPVGTDAQRNSAPKQGEIRFNLDQSTYEGYDGNNWGSLGGMNDVDQDTKITAETSAGADNDELQFFTAGTERLRILADGHISASANITSSGNLKILGNISSSTLTVSAASTASTAITTNNITNGFPTSNKWQENLVGSYFNTFDHTSHVSEILRFMAGVISHSIDTSAPTANLKYWDTVSTSHTQGSTTSKSSLLNGVLGSTYENARLSNSWTGSAFIDSSETQSYKSVLDYLELKGWVQSSDRGNSNDDVGTNPFHGSYASRIPSTIQTNATFDTLSHTITANAGGSSAIFSNSNYFGLGTLTSGGATAYSVRVLASQSFSDNYADSTPDKNSTFHTSSFVDYTQSSFGTSNGLILAKIDTAQPAVIPAAFQDGDFNSVAGPLSGRFHHTGSVDQNTISASGYYQMQDIKVGLKSGSQSDFTYKDGSDSTNRFYLYTGDLPSDITDGAPTPSITKNLVRTSFSATSRSLSGAPYLLTTTYGFTYSARATNCFDPCYGYNSTPLINNNPTDTWDNIGSTSLSNTSVSVTNSGVQSTGASTYVISSDFSTKRTSSQIPHISDVTVASSSFSFSLDSNSSNVVSARSTQESLNYSLTFKTTARNWKNSSTTSTTSAESFYDASLFGQPSSSGSMAVYSRAQGYDSNTLADTTETFTGEDFRIELEDKVQQFNGDYFTTDSYKTNDNGDAVLGDYDLQVKPGYLVDPGGTRGYWFPTNFGSGTYKYYIRRFQKSTSGTKTSMTINLGTSLVAWNSTSNGVACAILFESSGKGSGNNSSLGTARIYDPTATTSNVIEQNISNDNHKNPFSTAIDLYGNTGGEVSSTTYTIPIRNADGMFLDDSDNELYVLVRYKGDPTPITSITLSYS